MSNRFLGGVVALVCASALLPCDARAAQSSAPKPAPKTEPKPSKASILSKVDPTLPTRADLALAYVRFERALQANPPAGERLTEINSVFDKLTVAFFSGESRRAIETMNELSLELDPNKSALDAQRLAMSFRASIDPPMLFAGWTPRAALDVVQMYAPNSVEAPKTPLRFVLLDPSHAECAVATIP